MRCIRSLLHLSTAVLVGAFVALSAGAAEPAADAQPAPSPSPAARRGTRAGDVQKVFVLTHVRADDMAEILRVFPAEIRQVSHLSRHILSVSAAPAVVAAIEETIKRLDVPPAPAKSVEVTGYVLECSTQGTEAGTEARDLENVVQQLKRTFGYASCTLAQTLFTRGNDDAGFTTRSRLKTGPTSTLMTGSMTIDASQGTPVIRFRPLQCDLGGGVGFTGTVEVRDGHRVVLGKLGSTEGGKDQILVLTAKVQD